MAWVLAVSLLIVLTLLASFICVLRRRRRREIGSKGLDGDATWREVHVKEWVVCGTFAAFLSHYKVEAGADARILYGLLERILRARVFLDSASLHDVDEIRSAVKKCDCVIFFATRNVLTRPYCIFELCTAVEAGVPVVVLSPSTSDVLGHADAESFIRRIDTELEQSGAWAEVRRHLPGRSTEWIQQSLLTALKLDTPIETTSPWRLHFNAHGTDNQLLAYAKDIVASMASARGVDLCWREPHASEPLAATVPRWRLWPRGGQRLNHPYFISYYRKEAGAAARLLHLALGQHLGRVGFLDSSDLVDISALLEHVRRSECVILLQTANVMTRPWCLAEVYLARRLRIPVVPVIVSGGGYDHGVAADFMRDLPRRLEEANPGALANVRRIVEAQRLPMEVFAKEMSAISGLISVPFDPCGTSENLMEACLKDIFRTMRALKQRYALERGKWRSTFKTRTSLSAAPVGPRAHLP